MNSIIYFLSSFLLVAYKAYADSYAEKSKCILKGWFKTGMFWCACSYIAVSLPDKISVSWLFFCVIVTGFIYIGYYNFLLNRFMKMDSFYVSEKPGIINNTVLRLGVHPIEARLFCGFVSLIWFIFLLLQNSL